MVSQTDFRLLYLASLIESYAIYRAAAVSGWYFAHPESKYFGIPNSQGLAGGLCTAEGYGGK